MAAIDIEDFSARVIDLGKGLQSLCDDLYNATQEEGLDNETVNDLITQGQEKISKYEKLLNETSGGMKEEVEDYGDFIEEIRDFINELENKGRQ